MQSLRSRLILSHILPLVLIMPLLGIALIYTIEMRIVVPTLSAELSDQVHLLAETAHDYPAIWQQPEQARAFVDRFGSPLTARLMLLTLDGQVLAIHDHTDAPEPVQGLDMDTLTQVLAGYAVARTYYSRRLHTDLADVLMPVTAADGQVVGIVRLSHGMETVSTRFSELRYLIAEIILPGLLLGSVIGIGIALTLAYPLNQMTVAVSGLTMGQQQSLLNETGPTEVRALIRAVNTLQERLHTLEETRRRLLANLVHELGRPLGALHSALDALQGGADEDVLLRQELFAGMQTEIASLRRLLGDLTHLREQIVGTLELGRQPVALTPWLSGLLAPWREAAQARSLTWQATLAPDLPTIAIDPDRMAQALGNIVSNAITYTPPGGRMSVTADATDTAVRVCVQDSGPGIALAEQAHIFDPLYRSQTGRRFPQGMGLGLSIARAISVAHGGHIEVQSSPGQGSTFTLWIPATCEHTVIDEPLSTDETAEQ